jgi:hypothetical protein
VKPESHPDDGPAIDPTTEAPPAPHIGTPEPTRDSILAAFARNRTPPQSAPQPVPQPRPTERQAVPEAISDDGWDELIAGFMAGTVNWSARRLGPPPGDRNCRAPRHILRSFGL